MVQPCKVLAEDSEGKKISFGLGIALDFRLLTLEDYSLFPLASVLSDLHPLFPK